MQTLAALNRYRDAHLQVALNTAASHLQEAAIYAGMAHENLHWLDATRKSIAYAREKLEQFEAELAAVLAEPAADAEKTPALTNEERGIDFF